MNKIAQINIKRFGIIWIVSWTLTLAVLLFAILYVHHLDTMENPMRLAKDYYALNLEYRKWNAQLGGVYASSNKVIPNPHLTEQHRDIVATDGTKLTLINDAYMSQMVFESISRNSKNPIINKIVSLNPLSPKNSADPWERKALQLFAGTTVREVHEKNTIDGRLYLRQIHAFVTEESCLKCHVQHGLKIGDIIGGMSISIPLATDLDSEKRTNHIAFLGFILLWVVGCSSIAVSSDRRFKQEKKYRELVENANSIILRWTRDGVVTFLNEFGQRFFGYKTDEIVGQQVVGTIVPENESSGRDLKPLMEQILQDPERFEQNINENMCNNGERVWIAWTNKTVLNEHGEIVEILSIGTDITKQINIEKALEESRFFFQETQRAAFIGSYKADYVNDTWESSAVLDSILGIDESYTKNIIGWKNLIYPADLEVLDNYLRIDVIKERKKFNKEFRILRNSDSEIRWVLCIGEVLRSQSEKVIGLQGTIQDVTERKRGEEERHQLEQQFQNAQKLENLGLLAGGIAHDFNNILTVILGHCYLVRENFITEQELKATFMKIETAGNRAADLCRQMLTYAGKSSLVHAPVNLWLLIDEVTKMLKASINKNVSIELDLGPNIPVIQGDAVQIQQIAMNLIINAADAIGAASGTVRIVLTKVEFDTIQTAHDALGTVIKPGRYSCLEVTDTGCGMDEATIKRIFEPFFTTKSTGRGLGMSAILGIIKSHEAALQLFSTPGVGTTFKVFFPVPHAQTGG
jgi:PAS domain S-box-containing protein